MAALLIGAVGLLAAVDSGRFNTALAQAASRRLKRPVTFQTIHTHLLSAHPTVTVGGLRIGNPAWAGPGDLVRAGRVRLTLDWPMTLTGIEVDQAQVALLRLSRDQSSWTSGKGGGGGGDLLQSVRTLRVTNAAFVFDDRVHAMRLAGTLDYDPAKSADRPLAAVAQGTMKGGAVQLSARGGPLHHRPRGAPYPFSATLQDGEAYLEVEGTSAKPVQFSDGFDLAVVSHGPNLAVMKYLIGVGLPNSAPYRLTGRLARQGRTTRATGLKAVIGRSDFTGSVVSDGSRPRRMLTIKLDSQILYAADLGDFFASIPPHPVARSTPGSTRPKSGSGRVFSTSRIDLKRFRLKDAKLDITARRFLIDGLSPGRLAAVGTLDHGKFALKPFTIAFPSGRVEAAMTMDLNGEDPALRLDGTVSKASLASLVPSLGNTLSGTTDLDVHLAGAGGSWRAMAMNASGRIGVVVRGGEIKKAEANVISGAMIQGAFAALTDKTAKINLACAIAGLDVGRGRVSARRILLVSDAGTAVGQGGIDLGAETIDLTLYGRPAGFKLFTVKAPVSVTGPMLHPQSKLRLGGRPAGAGPALEAPKVSGDPAAFCNEQAAVIM